MTDDVASGSSPRKPYDPIDSDGGDCGFSEEMHDEYVLWVICDRGIETPIGRLPRDSNIGFAAKETPAAPVIRDGRLLGEPAVPGCAEHADFRWPTGLTSFPGGPGQTVVVVFYLEGCRTRIIRDPAAADDSAWDPGTTGVATFVYETGDGAGNASTALPEVTVHPTVWDGLFPNGEAWVQHGSGGVYSPDDEYLYAYACSRTDTFRPDEGETQDILGSGRCSVARTDPASGSLGALGVRGSWQYWSRNGSGGTWASCTPCGDSQLQTVLANQKPLDLAGTREFQYDQHFQVVYSEELDAFLAVHQRHFGARRAQMVIRVADNPAGPWSRNDDRLNLPINCDGRARTINENTDDEYDAFNCYQMRAHPWLGSTSDTSTVIGYFDTFTDPFPTSAPPVDPSINFDYDAIRFARVPLCTRRSGSATAVDYVRHRCLMQDLGTDWSTATVSRTEAAAIHWRLDGAYEHPIDPATDSIITRPNREPVSYLLDDPRDATPFWPAATDFAEPTPTTRGQLLRMLHRSVVPLSLGHPVPGIVTDWDPDWGDGLKQALRWAYDEGITCSTTASPFQSVTRDVTARWLQRFRVPGSACLDGM